ncbi:FAD-dependent monooxygenase [Streptomyces sp. FXJ1.172]|uniref:NAD(P)/FAD-dependent oxidoreductase n=1 Tax=Streptomyces sp. FXJ1.172 TaxID=710705 RepID=UPI000D184DA2|nr:FAD-dependent monooxygenase [Streptomyces sp. FXJ1.172]WEP00150.1 FAD-dependent monooxygenase [Streptomyces sp. FXJ1.172]
MSQKAVVVGAGTAGLVAAAALSLAQPRLHVVLLDRDELPEGPENRRGVPQGRHAHLLMAGGLSAMEALFPVSVRDRLLDAGAHQIALGNGMLALTADSGWLRRWRRNGPHMITCTRALLDWVLRQALLDSCPNVCVRRATVEGLLGDARRVRGVRIGAADHGPGSELEADLVVDASGRGSGSLQWLGELGITGVEVREIDSGLTNATRIYRRPAGAESFPLTMVQANPYNGRPGRSAMVLPIEGNRWMVSAGGTRGGEPPQDPRGFLEYALSLPHPIVGHLISGAQALTDVVVSRGRSTSNARRYFERSTRWPERFVVLGDALATFNPAYGQGMSVAALGAQVLARELQQGGLASPGLSRRVVRGAARHVDSAWAAAVGMDVLYPGVLGAEPRFADRLTARYTRRLTKAATGSPDAAAALWDVTSLTARPARVLRPKALLAALNGPLLPQTSEPPLRPSERAALDRLRKAATGGPDTSLAHNAR